MYVQIYVCKQSFEHKNRLKDHASIKILSSAFGFCNKIV